MDQLHLIRHKVLVEGLAILGHSLDFTRFRNEDLYAAYRGVGTLSAS